jgi:uncharacterized protein YhbP (UPF0306 family)
MQKKIIDFIEDHRVVTICCVDEENMPYCFSCFSAFDREKHQLLYKSSTDTRHSRILLENPSVAGTIQPVKLNPLAIMGIQFTGFLLDQDDYLCRDSEAIYHRKYPFASAIDGDVWCIQLQRIKMTDSTLGFGKKLLWESMPMSMLLFNEN